MTSLEQALRSVRALEKVFAQDAALSDLNRHGWGVMFGNVIQKHSLHNLPPIAYVPFALFNYVATRGLDDHMEHLISAVGVPVVPLPYEVRAELQRRQIVIGSDVLHTLMQLGIEQWPSTCRVAVFDEIFQHTPVADLDSPYFALRDSVLGEVATMHGRRRCLRQVLHFADGAAHIVGAIAPDAYVEDGILNWGAGI